MKNTLDDKLKKYSKYLLNEYDQLDLNKHNKTYIDLCEFHKNDCIKGIVHINASITTKKFYLEIYMDEILDYAKERYHIRLDLLTYNEFIGNYENA